MPQTTIDLRSSPRLLCLPARGGCIFCTFSPPKLTCTRGQEAEPPFTPLSLPTFPPPLPSRLTLQHFLTFSDDDGSTTVQYELGEGGNGGRGTLSLSHSHIRAHAHTYEGDPPPPISSSSFSALFPLQKVATDTKHWGK